MRKHTRLLPLLMAAFLSGFAPSVVAAEAQTLVPATIYFPVLPSGHEGSEVPPQLVPVAANHPLDGDHAGIKRAIIIVHDATRDANVALNNITRLAGAQNSSTLILAPQFLLDADILRFAPSLPERGKMFLRWPLDGWIAGGDSVAYAVQQPISSFTVLDLMLLFLGERKFFPDLQQIVVAGFGAGGDFIQHYAAAGQAIDVMEQQDLMPLRFVVANASSYLYFTAPRPKTGKQGFGSVDVAKCPSFNLWPYGLEQLNPYVRRVGGNAVKLNYINRPVIYLAGDKAALSDPFPDTSCAALSQGADRAARMKNYDAYLNIIYGEASRKLQSFVSMPSVGYDALALLGSSCGMSALFGDGVCNPSVTNARTQQ